ncbi:MAG: hypothetical protein IJD13_09995 [Oscillospiraceae bacterium]|nr:hypothetical protein [Oscillospiraceae bacterium]
MNSSDYNMWLARIKDARYMEESRARDVLRQIYNEMVSKYGSNDDDVQYLYKMFHLYI